MKDQSYQSWDSWKFSAHPLGDSGRAVQSRPGLAALDELILGISASEELARFFLRVGHLKAWRCRQAITSVEYPQRQVN